MNHVVLSGYYGFDNAGDEAVLKSIITDLKALDNTLKITVLSNNPKHTKETYHVESKNRWKLKTVFKTLLEADLLISGGGSLIQDSSSKRGLFYYLGVIFMAKLLRKPVMIYAQGLGPIQDKFNRLMTGLIFSKANKITFRDEASKHLFDTISPRKKEVTIVFDPVLGYEKPSETNILMPSDKKRLLFALRDWPNLDKTELIKALEALSHDYELYLLPMHKGSDTAFAKSILDSVHFPLTILRDDYDLDKLMGLFGEVDAVIAMRLHGLIIGANQEKPLIALSYDPKCDSFMAMLGDKHIMPIEGLDSNALKKMIDTLFDNKPIYLTRLKDAKARAKSTAEIALKLMKKP